MKEMFPYDLHAPQQPGVDPQDDLLIWAAATAAANDYNLYPQPPPPPPPVIPEPSGCQPYKTGETLHGSGGGGGGDEDGKLSRKEIERRRRQQMSNLHSDLLSLLPQRSHKGKKSLSDQMGEAANYISHLKSNVQQLSERRDNLLKGSTTLTPLFLTSSAGTSNTSDVVDNAARSSVTVRQRFDGVEVVISSSEGGEHDDVGGRSGGFVLSKVMEAVVEEGLDIISSVSTRIGGRFYNTMQCQASGWVTHIDLPGLQQKLNAVISYQSCMKPQ